MSLQQIQMSDVRSLLRIEDASIEAALPHGLKLHRSPASLIPHLLSLSPERLALIVSNLTVLTDVLLTCTEDQIDPWDDRLFLGLSMKAMHLSFPNDFLDHVRPDDLIEGYDSNRMQIFRNMRFMEYSNYSLLQIISLDWPQLFDRPTAITDKMITFCDETLWAHNRTIAFDVPAHFMRELQTKERGVFEVQFRRLAPLFSGPNQPFGILGSSNVKPIETAISKDNVAFL